MVLRFLVSFGFIFLASVASASNCVYFPAATYRCLNARSQVAFDIVIQQDISGPFAKYRVVQTYSNRVDTFALAADGNEAKFDDSPTHALYRSAICGPNMLDIESREMSVNAGQVSSESVSSVYSLVSDLAVLRISSAVTVAIAGSAPYTLQDLKYCNRLH
jgi:hypothetical protein